MTGAEPSCGGPFISVPSGGSSASPIAGSTSVKRLIHSSCAGLSGRANPLAVANSISAISLRLVAIR